MIKTSLIIAVLTLMSFSTLVNIQGDESKDIIEVLSSSENLSTLSRALKAANLNLPLTGEGPFTIFAPSNKAFDKLSKDSLISLLKPQNKKKLKLILTYHVLQGKYDFKKLNEEFKKYGGTVLVKTLNGQTIKIRKGTDGYYLKDGKTNYSKILIKDMEASNGIIHTVSKVVMPE